VAKIAAIEKYRNIDTKIEKYRNIDTKEAKITAIQKYRNIDTNMQIQIQDRYVHTYLPKDPRQKEAVIPQISILALQSYSVKNFNDVHSKANISWKIYIITI
jgi:hypothetical protein